MEKENKLIIVSNHEAVEADDFYLSDEWAKHSDQDLTEARELQKEGRLYIAYIVDAVSLALFSQMDADQVFVDIDNDVVVYCESQVIDDKWNIKELLDN